MAKSKVKEGWFWSDQFSVYQKVNNEIYVYVSPLIFGWKAQAYERGNVSICTLEARSNDGTRVGFTKMISLGNEWLQKYGDDKEAMETDFFHIDKGEAWTNGGKEFWI